MLARDVTVEDFDAEDWLRLGDIVRAGAGGDGATDGQPSGGIVLVADQRRIIKLLHTVRGRLDPAGAAPDTPLADLAKTHRAGWAVRLFPGALRLLSARYALCLERTDDFESQVLKLVGVVRELDAEGAVQFYPTNPKHWPVPSARTMKLFWDTICPVGKSMLFAALDGSEVTTSLALHRGPRGFDRVVGPERVRRETGLRSDDFRQNYRGVARAVELTVGPLALGCFAEAATWARLIRDRTPGAWAAAAASREIVFYPLAPALAIPLGIDVGRVAWALARDIADRLGVAARDYTARNRF
jgi:hypothetical protein